VVTNCNLTLTTTSGLQRRHWSNSRLANKVSRTANAAVLGINWSTMNIEINGKIIDSSSVTANHGMQFGQFRSNDLAYDSYRLRIERNEFVALFEKDSIQARGEIKADDILCNEVSGFTTSGYADLGEIFSFKRDLADIISTYLDRKIF
jgi:hypothetical protein